MGSGGEGQEAQGGGAGSAETLSFWGAGPEQWAVGAWGEAGRGSSWGGPSGRRGLIRACPSDEREAVQKKTFTKWVNSHLARVGCHIGDLYADLRDGFVLTRLLEVLSGEQLVRGRGGWGTGVGPGSLAGLGRGPGWEGAGG